MTVDEMRKKIEDFCNGYHNCIGCPLYNNDCDYYDCYSSELDDSIIKRNYNIIKNNITNSVSDSIKPSYYNDSKITPFDVIDDWNLDFYLGNAIKYIKRCGKKCNNTKLQDLRKAKEYIEELIRKEDQDD